MTLSVSPPPTATVAELAAELDRAAGPPQRHQRAAGPRTGVGRRRPDQPDHQRAAAARAGRRWSPSRPTPSRSPAAVAAAVGTACRSPRAARAPATTGRASRWPAVWCSTLSRARTIVEVGDGAITADAGATFVALERAAARHRPADPDVPVDRAVDDRRLPVRRVGRHRLDQARDDAHRDFVARPRRRPRHPATPELVHVEGEEAAAVPAQLRHRRDHRPGHRHARTAAGLARAVRQLRPLRAGAVGASDRSPSCEPTPRLVSADPPMLAEALPADAGIPGRPGEPAGHPRPGVAGRRPAARRGRRRAGRGRPRRVRHDPPDQHDVLQPPDRVAAEGATPTRTSTSRSAATRSSTASPSCVEVYPGGLLHIEAKQGRPTGMLAAPYRSAGEVVRRLRRG